MRRSRFGVQRVVFLCVSSAANRKYGVRMLTQAFRSVMYKGVDAKHKSFRGGREAGVFRRLPARFPLQQTHAVVKPNEGLCSYPPPLEIDLIILEILVFVYCICICNVQDRDEVSDFFF